MEINNDNFELYAAKVYDSVKLSKEDFNEDIKRFSYVMKLLYNYKNKNILKHRLILNHIIILGNVFPDDLARLLFFKLSGYEIEIKTFLKYLNRMPDVIYVNNDHIVYDSNLPIDMNIWLNLQGI